MAKVFVAGGTGYMGRTLIGELLRHGHEVRALARAGSVPGGTRANLEFVAPRTRFPEQMEEADRLVLADAQTNGGMLAAVSSRIAERLLRKLADAGVPATLIGEVVPRGKQEPGVTFEGALQG